MPVLQRKSSGTLTNHPPGAARSNFLLLVIFLCNCFFVVLAVHIKSPKPQNNLPDEARLITVTGYLLSHASRTGCWYWNSSCNITSSNRSVVFKLEVATSRGLWIVFGGVSWTISEGSRGDILYEQLYYVCFIRVLDRNILIIVGCYNGLRCKKGWKPLSLMMVGCITQIRVTLTMEHGLQMQK